MQCSGRENGNLMVDFFVTNHAAVKKDELELFYFYCYATSQNRCKLKSAEKIIFRHLVVTTPRPLIDIGQTDGGCKNAEEKKFESSSTAFFVPSPKNKFKTMRGRILMPFLSCPRLNPTRRPNDWSVWMGGISQL